MATHTDVAVDLKDKEELKEGSSVEVMQAMNWSIHLFARYTKSYVPAIPAVDPKKIEELARDKMKDYPGKTCIDQYESNDQQNHRRFHVWAWKCWNGSDRKSESCGF